MRWIGERFFTQNGRWFDTATAEHVDVWTGELALQAFTDWNDRCGQLATLRHPLLNPLLDWGIAAGTQVFEAYAIGGEARARGVAGESALDHVARFLRAAGVVVDHGRSRHLARPLAVGDDEWLRPVGVTLQTRPALDAIEEALEHARGAGPVVITAAAPSAGSGLRTLRMLAARAARIRGYLPVSIEALARFPELLRHLRGRHLCVLHGPGEVRDGVPLASRLLAEVSVSGARRHLVVRFERRSPSAHAIPLGPMPTRSLVGMVYADAEHGPGEEELFAAARAADGNPGLFLRALSCGFQRSTGAMVVHEAPAEFAAPAEPEPVERRRVIGSALRAVGRAATLARAGRHSSAARVLERAFRVLTARGHRGEAAACAWHLGALALDRGKPDVARQRFAEGRALAEGDEPGLHCLIGEGVALVDMDRLVEAEAVLRAAVATADLSAGGSRILAAAALARCLYWQQRHHEAVGVAGPLRDVPGDPAARVRLLAILARAETRLGRAAAAVATARGAVALAQTTDAALRVSADLALAESLAAAGDLEGACTASERGASIARASHLPLSRARAALVQCALRPGESRPRVTRGLERLHMPPLLARRQRATAGAELERASNGGVTEVESLLDLTQRSADDRSALGAICQVVAERLRTSSVAIVADAERVLHHQGRAPSPLPSAVRETLASGSRVPPEPGREPREAAEPVRYGGEVIAALVCRWPAGAAVDADDAKIVLRAAALSAAAPVRAILDQVIPDAPSAAWADLIGTSPGAVALRDAVTRAARAPFPVLIEGESGSGKELVARAIHRLGPRRDRRFCALNCAALTEDLLEAELFGHTRGAFTGAAGDRAGIFEEADGGTVFLDEVGELSARAQAKLLRVIQEGEVRRVGENLPRHVDVRIVAATNRSLEQEALAGRFRADLRFRLDVVRLTVPPLRDRVSDIPLLANHFWRDASQRVGSQATLSGEVLAALSRYDWPGNVRELQNVIAWMAVHSPRRGRVGVLGLPEHIARARPAPAASLDAAREEFERRFIRAALATAQGRRSKAADALGITRQGLAKMMRRLRIDAP